MKVEKVQYNGVTYNSFYSACNDLNIKYVYALKLIRELNFSREEVIDYFLLKKEMKEYLDSINQSIKHIDVYFYMKEHDFKYSVKEAIDELLSDKAKRIACRYKIPRNNYVPKKQFVFNDVTYINLRHACQMLGFSYSYVINLRSRFNLNTEQALHYYHIKKCCEKKYKQTSTHLQTMKVYKYWLKNDVSYDEAVEIIFHRIKKQQEDDVINASKKTFEINGVKYKTLRHACDDLGLKYASVRQYKYTHNMTNNELINYYLEHTDSASWK